MNYRKYPELIERLAAEYVLGTLRGQARARFARLVRDDAAIRRVIGEWEARLAPMAATVREVTPPRRIWEGIRARIAGPAPAARSLWDSLDFWRNLGLVASGCAAALIAAIALRQPEIVRVPVPSGKIAEASSKRQESYVATLSDKSGKVVAVAYAARDSNELWVKRIDVAPGADQDLELWALPADQSGAPKSLGLLPAKDKGNIKLAAVADQSLKDVPALAISLEPAGGSKTGAPTGPVLASGPCVKFW